MAEFRKYVFRNYSERFPGMFRRERDRIRKLLGKGAIIEHCGSTAVPGLGGKGIVDVCISVRKNEWEKSKERLIRAGYSFHPEDGSSLRYFFHRDYTYSGVTRRVHVHLTFDRSIEFRRHVALVKYMRAHPEVARKYEAVKMRAVRRCKGSGEAYRRTKEKFLEKTSRKALEEFG